MGAGPTRALVRGIPATFADALAKHRPAAPIDVARARAQHAAYVAALGALGLAVTELPADDAHPDCGFVEDCAIVARGRALATMPGAPSRRGEVPPVRAALAAHLEVAGMALPATLDGGDAMVLGDRLYVGQTARTNPAGLARAAEVFAPLGLTVVPVPLPPDVLHLKCVCSPLGPDVVLAAEGALPGGTFGDARVVAVPAAEAYAANAIAVGRGVVIAAGHPETRRRLEAAGYDVFEVETSEVRKADGSLTCGSILY